MEWDSKDEKPCAAESGPKLICEVIMWCDAIGDPARHPKTSEHGSPVPASDVRSPAAAPHAADSSPAAAPALPPSAECGHHTTGQMVSVLWVILTWAIGCVTTLQYIPGFGLSETVTFIIQQQSDSSACWCFPKLSKYPCCSLQCDLLSAQNLTSASFFFIILHCAALNTDYVASISSDSAADWPNPKLQFHWCCNHHIPAGHAAGKQTGQL